MNVQVVRLCKDILAKYLSVQLCLAYWTEATEDVQEVEGSEQMKTETTAFLASEKETDKAPTGVQELLEDAWGLRSLVAWAPD